MAQSGAPSGALGRVADSSLHPRHPEGLVARPVWTEFGRLGSIFRNTAWAVFFVHIISSVQSFCSQKMTASCSLRKENRWADLYVAEFDGFNEAFHGVPSGYKFLSYMSLVADVQ